jgi:predicted glycosyltransferase
LARVVWKRQPQLAIGHGSVDLAVVSASYRIPSVQMQDYEFAQLQRQIAFRLARRVLAPETIPVERLAKLGAKGKKLVRYPGLKEEYYLAGFEPDPAVLGELGLDREKVLVVVRPPPETSEYHARNDLYGSTIERLAAASEAQAVVIPRTEDQGAAVRARGAANLIVPERAIDAQSLIAYADLVVSAGGTMNREAVALGTPVFTTFTGRMGGVDEALIADGRLQVLADPAALQLRKRDSPVGVRHPRDAAPLVEGALQAVDRLK